MLKYIISLIALLMLNISIAKAEVPVCDQMEPTADGSGGFVSTPETANKRLKIVLPEDFKDVSKVRVVAKNDSFSEIEYRRQPDEWYKRPKFYGNFPLSHYNTPIRIVATTTDGKKHCWDVDDPQEKQD